VIEIPGELACYFAGHKIPEKSLGGKDGTAIPRLIHGVYENVMSSGTTWNGIAGESFKAGDFRKVFLLRGKVLQFVHEFDLFQALSGSPACLTVGYHTHQGKNLCHAGIRILFVDHGLHTNKIEKCSRVVNRIITLGKTGKREERQEVLPVGDPRDARLRGLLGEAEDTR
jgi:hypothetical protein